MWLLIGCWQEQDAEHKAIIGLFHDISEAVSASEGVKKNPNVYTSYWIQEVPVKTPCKIIIQ